MTEKNRAVQQQAHIRWMIKRDYPEVLEIEALSYEQPWTEEDFTNCLRQRNCVGQVVEIGDRVVGYVVYELHRKSMDIRNIAVHPEFRRQSLGAMLITKLIGKLSTHRRPRAFLMVRESNLGMQLFLRTCGFSAIDNSRKHYDDTGEDGIEFEYSISED